ncbi:ATP-binding protein [Paucibacter sp. KBW04]|uniref:sensor histidine kinase n=1 Tax=Paucibacter sp. KBW04 TaxID=2153361 RepID=UPI001E3BBF42|nr:ATP-binding protein [Paucibacter sp. KBW04]
MLSALAAILLLWLAVSALLLLRRQEAIDGQFQQNANLARAFEEQTLRVLEAANQATLRARDGIAAGHGESSELVRFANETGLAPKILAQLSWVDNNGHLVASNLDPKAWSAKGLDLSARDHIRVHLAPQSLPEQARLSEPDALYIGRPVLGKVSNKWTIQLSRRVADAQGRLLGVVVASLDPSYFEDVFRRVDLGRTGGVTLIGQDLLIRSRVIGGAVAKQGGSFPPHSVFAQQALGKQEARLIGIGTVDGIDRLITSRHISPYPLYLLISVGREEALARWHDATVATLVLSLLLSLLIAGAAAGLIASLRRQERSAAALRRSEAQAQAANQAKSEFLTAMSHELRTPLTSIRGFAELMEQRLEDPKFRKQAGLIRKGAEHLSTLLTEILDLAKVEAGGMTLNQDLVNPAEIVQGCADFFALSAANKGLELKIQVDEHLPASLSCDGLRLKQILNNLLSNAIKFTVQGGVTLSAQVQAGRIDFHVDDTGPGIPASLQQRIFEKFRQANDQVSTQHGGTGLGLALSRGLAELMQGELTVSSVPGQGSRFTLSLPIAPAAAEQPEA